ncbi:hypothetical protein OTK49_02775 [Vibrio coralliirubri]|uniref:hypothetical protein n=1 Tax=Vibrio coralliirubri TaxID=1516159 RepID=UPI0022845B44|nr:hypothetical protein [Vibrio coralliirubri]MCY9861442.1 hypothetical protein [Vibrio coralliirubri]
MNSQDTYFLDSSELRNGTQNVSSGFTYEGEKLTAEVSCPRPTTDVVRSTEMVASNKQCTVIRNYRTTYHQSGGGCASSRVLVSKQNTNCKYTGGGGSGGNGACGANGCGGGAGGGGGR